MQNLVFILCLMTECILRAETVKPDHNVSLGRNIGSVATLLPDFIVTICRKCNRRRINMKRKDLLMLSAAMMGIASGWAVLNDQVYAMTEDEYLPQSETATDEEQQVLDTSVTIPDSGSESGSEQDPGVDVLQTDDPVVPDTTSQQDSALSAPEEIESGESVTPDKSDTPADTDADSPDSDKEEPEESELPEGESEDSSQNTESADQPEAAAAVTATMKAPLRAVAGPTNGWSNNKYYVNGTVSTGETKIGQDRYLFDNDGNPLKGFMYYDGKLLYCTSAGKIQTGSFTVDKQTFTADTSGNITSMNCQNVPYYNQLDSRWSGIVIGQGNMGSTACTMMSATTVINFFNNTNYSPVDIAQDCHNAGYYNGRVPGTLSSVWKYVSGKYGLTYKEGLNLDTITQSLLEGNIVVGGVGYSRWCPWYGSTHQIYMTGYKNGQVQVYDPYQRTQCGWFNLSDIWSVKSTDPDDNLNNGPFFALGKRRVGTVNSSMAAYGTVVIGDQAYTGSAVKGNPIVGFYQNGSYIQLKEGKDYTVSYANNVKAGEARITVTGKGLYKGTISRNFFIVNNIVQNSTYTLQSSGNTNYVLDVTNGSTAAGTPFQLYASNKTGAQQFKISRQSNGYYTIQNKNSGLYLTSSSDWRNLRDGLVLTQTSFKKNASCLWMIRATSNGYVISSAFDSRFVLDIPGATFTNGNKIQLYTRNGTSAQVWRFQDIEQAIRDLEQLAKVNKNCIDDGYYIIQSAVNNKQVIDVNGAGTSDRTNIQIYNSNNTWAQLFRISHSGDFLQIKNVNSDKVLDVENGAIKSGANLQIYEWNGTKAQLWIAVQCNDGIKLVSALDKDLVMDLNGANPNDRTNISIYKNNNTLAQRWIFRRVEDPRAVLDRLALSGKNLVEEGVYEIHSSINKIFNLDVSGGSFLENTNVQLYSDNDTGAQRWIIKYDDKGYAMIQNIQSKKYLSLASKIVQSGTNIVQKTGSTYSQKWIFKSIGNSIQIASAWNDKYVIDLSGAHAVDGWNIQLYANNGTNAQKWHFVKISSLIGAAAGDASDNGNDVKPINPIKADYWNGQVLTPKLGIVEGPSGKESYYNLNMDGVLKIMRSIGINDKYWLREDGVKMLGKNIMVAANLETRPRGSLIKTTLGMAIVCDTGDFVKKDPTQIDVAVGWMKNKETGLYYIDPR